MLIEIIVAIMLDKTHGAMVLDFYRGDARLACRRDIAKMSDPHSCQKTSAQQISNISEEYLLRVYRTDGHHRLEIGVIFFLSPSRPALNHPEQIQTRGRRLFLPLTSTTFNTVHRPPPPFFYSCHPRMLPSRRGLLTTVNNTTTT